MGERWRQILGRYRLHPWNALAQRLTVLVALATRLDGGTVTADLGVEMLGMRPTTRTGPAVPDVTAP